MTTTAPPERVSRRSRQRAAIGPPIGDRSRKAEIATLALLAVLTLVSALAAGGAFPTVVMILSPLAIAAAVASTWITRSRRAGTGLAFFVFAGLALYTLVQLIPLPAGILDKLSPQGADIWSRCLLPFGETVGASPLTLDPNATTLEALKWVSYACVFAAASAAARRRGAEYGALIVFGSAVVVAFITLGHQLVEATKLYGIYHPTGTAETEVAPFLNKNNLAGYCNLGVFCGAALLFSRRVFVPRPLAASGIVVLMAVSLRSGSRAGFVTLIVGVLVLAALLFVVRSQRGPRAGGGLSARATVLVVIGTLVAGVLVAFVAGGDHGVVSKLSSQDVEKFHIPIWAKPMAWDFKWTGVGRGAFESVFPAYVPHAKYNLVFTHPENFIVQWITEWGAVGAVGLATLFWLFRPTRLGITRSALHAGVTVGVATLLLHNLGDLSLELFGVGTALSLLLGSTWGDAKRRGADERDIVGSVLPVRLVAGLGAVVLVLAIRVGAHSVSGDRADVFDLLHAHPVNEEALKDEIHTGMRRHPADYFFPMAGAMMAEETGADPIPWIQRALERGPHVGRTHLVLAELLARRGITNQALLELRLSVENEPDLAGSAAIIAVRASTDGERLLRAVPDGIDGLPMLEAIAGALDPQRSLATRERIDLEALSRDPKSRAPRERLVAIRLESLKKQSPPCEDKTKCEGELADHATALTKYFPESSRGDQVRAAVLIVDDRKDDARALLDKACKARDDAPACLTMLAPLVDLDALPDVLNRYASASCSNRIGCAAAYDWIASTYESRHQWGQALSAREKAIEQTSTEARLLAAAATAENGDLYADAIRLLERLARTKKTRDPALDARISADQQKLTGSGIK